MEGAERIQADRSLNSWRSCVSPGKSLSSLGLDQQSQECSPPQGATVTEYHHREVSPGHGAHTGWPHHHSGMSQHRTGHEQVTPAGATASQMLREAGYWDRCHRPYRP